MIIINKIAILQSNYIPWKGVFDMINQVDIFVFLEDVQYTQQDWRNRNIVKTSQGDKWITVPVKNSNRNKQLIKDVQIVNNSYWQRKHYNTFQMNYAKSPFFEQYRWILEDIYINNKWTNLSDMNIYIIKLISKELGIKTKFIKSTDLNVKGEKSERLVEICKKLKGEYYLSGPAAKNYIEINKFKNANIKLDYIKYEYPKYRQLHEPFSHYVTILDVLFNCGKEAPYYIWKWRECIGEVKYDTF